MPVRGESIEVMRFGQTEPLEVEVGDALVFPQGIVGMEDLRRFVLVDDPRVDPCRWLQSLDQPSLAFLVVDPHLIVPDYIAHVPEDVVADLNIADTRDAGLWAIVTIQPIAEESTANLLAPVVVNYRARLGRQVILTSSGYSLRHTLGPTSTTEPASETNPVSGSE